LSRCDQAFLSPLAEEKKRQIVLLRTTFASLARAHVHERVRVQNGRDFPQTKLDSEIYAPFLRNEHGDPHFLFHNFNENNIFNN